MRFLRSGITLLTAFLSTVLVFHVNLAAQGSDTKEEPGKPDYSKEASVVEQLHTRYKFENNGLGSRDLTLRVRIQSEAGVRQWGQLPLGYNSANERMQIEYVRVVKPDGSIVTAGPDSVQELTLPIQRVAPVYTDYKQKLVTVPALRPGDVLEVHTTTAGETPLAADQFWMQHDFQKNVIVLDEELDVDIPAEREVKVKSKPSMDPKITQENTRKIYHWSSSHLVREDSNKDSEKQKKKKKAENEIPDVQLSTFSSWEEVGRWYHNLEKPQRVPSPVIRAKADELVKGQRTDLDKVQALYDYAAKNFRYVSLSLGLGRYQPHPADEVLRNQYGDCKDKSTLLEALLDAQGFHASAALINAYRKLDPDIPSPSQLNHVITVLSLGKDEVWMDTTTEVAPFRLLSFNLRKKQALVVPWDGTPRLEDTPADPPMQDTELLNIDGQVDDSGRLDAKITYQVRGDQEILMRHAFRSLGSAQWQQVVEGMAAREGLGKEVSEVKISDTEATQEPFSFSYRVSKPGFLDWSKQKTQIKLPLAIIGLVAISPDDQDDTDPIKLGPAVARDYRIKLDIPAKYTVRTPLPVSVKRDYADYEANYQLNENVLTAERKLNMHIQELPPSHVQDYLAFRNSVLTDIGQQLSLETTATAASAIPTGMKPEELVKKGESERRNGNYKLAIDLLKKAVDSDPKSRNGWNDLGLAYFDSRQDEPAIVAFQKQIEINSYDQYAYNNLGRVYLRQRNYEQAVKWFRKQIEVVPLDKYAHANLGITFVDWQKWAEAIPELQQAISLTPDNATLQVRLGEAYLNLDQDEKAMSAFGEAVKLSPTPGTWNNVAYQLALKKVHLDLAENYADSAISTSTAALKTLSLDQVSTKNTGWTSSLGASWDTLGWIKFAQGDLQGALKYVIAAWQLDQTAEEADHAGQIYEKLGEKQSAIYFYALALNARQPRPEIKERLTALVGGDKEANSEIDKYRSELEQGRTLKIRNATKQTGTADFFVLLHSDKAGFMSAGEAKFVSGDPQLKAFADPLRSVTYSQAVPNETNVTVLRRGTLTCTSTDSECTFILTLASDTRVSD